MQCCFLLPSVIGGYNTKFSRRKFDTFISDRTFVVVSDTSAVSYYVFCSVAANWDGIYDNETGMLMYTWAVGTSPCGGDVVPHNDPHEHLASASEWTNIGVAFPLNLPGK